MLQKFTNFKNAVKKGKKSIKQNFKNLTAISYLALIAVLGSIMVGVTANGNPNYQGPQHRQEMLQRFEDSSKMIQVPTQTIPQVDSKDSIRRQLAIEIDLYISSRFPKSELTGKSLVEICEKHDFDICFALAQAEIESGLGTAGKGKTCKNPWNVGAFDGRSVQVMKQKGHAYSHPDHSIEPYIVLVKTKYLGSKRTIHDLMKNYVNLNGHRYASGRGYEVKLKNVYQRICKNTLISKLQNELKLN